MVTYYKAAGGGAPTNVTVTNTPLDVGTELTVDIGDINIADIEPIPGKPLVYTGSINDASVATVISGDTDGTRQVSVRCPETSAVGIDLQLDQSTSNWVTLQPGGSYTADIRVGKTGDSRDLKIRRNGGSGTADYEVVATF